jgi:hypothetical protein
LFFSLITGQKGLGRVARRLSRPKPRCPYCFCSRGYHQPTPFQLKKKFGGGKSQKNKAKGFSGGSTTAKAVEALGLRPIGKADALRALILKSHATTGKAE